MCEFDETNHSTTNPFIGISSRVVHWKSGFVILAVHFLTQQSQPMGAYLIAQQGQS